MRGWVVAIGAVALAVAACGGSCPGVHSSSGHAGAVWEAELDRRAVLPLDGKAAISIKRDVHNVEVDIEASVFVTAFHDVMRDPARRFGLIRIDRKAANAPGAFHEHERFQGRYELDVAIKQNFHGWAKKAFGDVANDALIREFISKIEQEDTSDFGEITQLNLTPAPGEPYVIAYQYLCGTPIAGSSTFTVIPLGPSRSRLTQTFVYQEGTLAGAAFFSVAGLKLHDQVVLSQATQAAELAKGKIVYTDIPADYAAH